MIRRTEQIYQIVALTMADAILGKSFGAAVLKAGKVNGVGREIWL